MGYYALATGAVMPDDATERLARGVGGYAVPVVILTRLGVDRAEQGRGLGRALVVDALRRVAGAAEVIGLRALVLHAEDDRARDFYLHLANFESSPADSLHLVLLLKDLRRALGQRSDALMESYMLVRAKSVPALGRFGPDSSLTVHPRSDFGGTLSRIDFRPVISARVDVRLHLDTGFAP